MVALLRPVDPVAEFSVYLGLWACTCILRIVNRWCTCARKVHASTHALVKKMNKSSEATERLLSLCGKKLTSDCPMEFYFYDDTFVWACHTSSNTDNKLMKSTIYAHNLHDYSHTIT